MLVIGINAYHGDAAACIVQEGTLIAAAEEERFRRVKHWTGFPSEAIRYCLGEAKATLADVDHVAINQDPNAHFWRKVWFALSRLPNAGMIVERLRARRRNARVDIELELAFPDQRFRGEVHHVEHHLSHLGSAFHVCPFERAVAISVDGFGDFSSAAWGVGHGGKLRLDGQIYFPHSLGIFYQALTQFLGFPRYGDEYKVMGLAAYGEPRYQAQMRSIIQLQPDGGFRLNLRYFRHHRERINYQWDKGEPIVGCLFSADLETLVGPARGEDQPMEQRHHDIACSVQSMYEEAFFHFLNGVHRRYQIADLVLAGGCAMNSLANGRICARSPFRRVYVQSAAGDAGGAIGAAFVVWNRVDQGSTSTEPRWQPSALAGGEGASSGRRFVMDHAYWGPGYPDHEIRASLDLRKAELADQRCPPRHIADESELYGLVANRIAIGLVVGWFQGRMEWGPRALGNRSIVCDPRRADMKDILNQKIKRRESFRPFAPSILREAVAEWFETDDDVPFMTQVYQIRREKRALIPAVTHVDGSGRLQTVHRPTNPRFYRLIEEFAKLSGIPILLNTSFNENEPVVCRPDEALDCFLRTRMDVLVLGNWYLARQSPVV